MLKINQLIQKVELFLGKILVAVILIVSTLQIICRYGLKKPLNWTEEIACYSLVWITFLSMCYLYSKWSHVALTIVEGRLSERTNTILKIIFAVLIALGLVCLLPASISSMGFMPPSPALRIPQQYIFVIVPVAYVLLIFHSICLAWENILKLRGKEVQ